MCQNRHDLLEKTVREVYGTKCGELCCYKHWTLESVQNWKFCKMILFLARSRFEYCASWASPKKLARHWSLGPSLEMSPKFGKLASTSPCKWSIFKLIHYFFPFPCFIYLHLIQFYVRLNKITFLYVSIIENIRSKAL